MGDTKRMEMAEVLSDHGSLKDGRESGWKRGFKRVKEGLRGVWLVSGRELARLKHGLFGLLVVLAIAATLALLWTLSITTLVDVIEWGDAWDILRTQMGLYSIIGGVVSATSLSPVVLIVGGSCVSRELEGGSMASLASLPLKRSSIALGKTLAGFLLVLFLSLSLTLGAWGVCTATLGPPPLYLNWVTFLFVFASLLYTLCLAQLLSSLIPRQALSILATLIVLPILLQISIFTFENAIWVGLLLPNTHLILLHMLWFVEPALGPGVEINYPFPPNPAASLLVIAAALIILQAAYIAVLKARDI